MGVRIPDNFADVKCKCLNQAELAEMRAEHEAMKEHPKVTLRAMVTTSSLRRPLVIAVMMMMAQQLSGINAAFFFSTSIFKSAGMEEGTAQVSPVSNISRGWHLEHGIVC